VDRDRWIDLALSCLRQAVENGYQDTAYLEVEVDLEPLRQMPEFVAVVAQAESELSVAASPP
jgi:hypothetical protein